MKHSALVLVFVSNPSTGNRDVVAVVLAVVVLVVGHDYKCQDTTVQPDAGLK